MSERVQSNRIDPSDLAPHNARACVMLAKRLQAVEALDAAKQAADALAESSAAIAQKYGLQPGDDWHPETGEIVRAAKPEPETGG